MKSTELMLGDLVKVHFGEHNETIGSDVYGQVAELYDDGRIEVAFNGSSSVLWNIEKERGDEILPIPLTQEVLDKNGFVCVEVGDDGLGTPPKYRNRYEKWNCRTQWHTFSVFYDRITHRFSINARYSNHIEGMQYVHELQHALRISGIDKEVEL